MNYKLDTLSDQQYNLLMYVADYLWEHGYQPLQSEMGDHLGVTRQAARNLLVKLELKGYVRRVHKHIYLLHVPGFPHARQLDGKTAVAA